MLLKMEYRSGITLMRSMRESTDLGVNMKACWLLGHDELGSRVVMTRRFVRAGIVVWRCVASATVVSRSKRRRSDFGRRGVETSSDLDQMRDCKPVQVVYVSCVPSLRAMPLVDFSILIGQARRSSPIS